MRFRVDESVTIDILSTTTITKLHALLGDKDIFFVANGKQLPVTSDKHVALCIRFPKGHFVTAPTKVRLPPIKRGRPRRSDARPRACKGSVGVQSSCRTVNLWAPAGTYLLAWHLPRLARAISNLHCASC